MANTVPGGVLSPNSRTKWLASLLPKEPLQPWDFQTGLAADDFQGEQVKLLIREHFDAHGLINYESLTESDGRLKLDQAVQHVTTRLVERFTHTDEWFISCWVEALLIATWDYAMNLRKEKREGKIPSNNLTDPASIPYVRTISPTGKITKTFRNLPLDRMAVSLTRLSSDGRKVGFIGTETLNSTRFLEEGKPGEDPHSYSLRLFYAEFEKAFNVGKKNNLFRFGHGKFGYIPRQGKTFTEIIDEKDFEKAITTLFHVREGHDCIGFVHYDESEQAKKARRAEEQAIVASSRKLKAPRIDPPTSRLPTWTRRHAKPEEENPAAAGEPKMTLRSHRDPPPPKTSPSPRRIPAEGTKKPNNMRQNPPSTHRGGLSGTNAKSDPPRKIIKQPLAGSKGAKGPDTNKALPKTPTSSTSHPGRRTSIIGRGINALHDAGRKISLKPGEKPPPKSASMDEMTHEVNSMLAELKSKGGGSAKSHPTGSTSTSVLPLSLKKESERKTESAPVDSKTSRFAYSFRVTDTKAFMKGGIDEVDLSKTRIMVGDDDPSADKIGEEEEMGFVQMDYITRRLQGLLVSEQLSQLGEEKNIKDIPQRWVESCQMFNVNPSKTSVDDVVNVYGLTHPLYQFQSFVVYWQMQRSRSFGGGFVGDEMGLGKTLSYLAYIVVERQLAIMWKEVEDSRQNRDKRHLQETEHKQNDKCPSEGRADRVGWIVCPCASSNITSTMRAKNGLRLACVPRSLVLNWKEQWYAHIAQDSTLQMKLIIAHNPSNVVPVGGGYDNIDARHPRNVAVVKAKKRRLESAVTGKHDSDQPVENQERILILCTEASYKSWAKQFEYKAEIATYPKNEEPVWVKGHHAGIVFGIAMIDECHEQTQKGKGRPGVLADLPKVNHPFLWGYSGTPITSSPRALEGVLWAIECHWPKRVKWSKETGWEQHDHLKLCSNKRFDAVCKKYERIQKDGSKDKEAVKDFLTEINPFLKTFMIRSTTDTLWFGRPLMKLKPHKHQDIVLEHNTSFDDSLALLNAIVSNDLLAALTRVQEAWETEDPHTRAAEKPEFFSFVKTADMLYKPRIMSTFPFLVNFANWKRPHHLTFLDEETIRLMRSSEEKRSIYNKFTKQICENSPKCMWLYDFILKMDQTKDVDRQENKVVIISEFMPVALLLKYFIEKHIEGKKDRVGLIVPGQKQKERMAILEAFTDALDGNRKRKQKQNYQFLIGTAHLIGAGLQLARASTVILMEPNHRFYRELQGYARVNRIGQRNPMSFSYRLIDSGSEIEKSILKRQRDRNEYPGIALAPPASPTSTDSSDDLALAQVTSIEELVKTPDTSVGDQKRNWFEAKAGPASPAAPASPALPIVPPEGSSLEEEDLVQELLKKNPEKLSFQERAEAKGMPSPEWPISPKSLSVQRGESQGSKSKQEESSETASTQEPQERYPKIARLPDSSTSGDRK